MAEEKANKPIIRFAGFTDSWEQRKFYNIATRNSVFGKSSPTLPGIEYEDLISGEGLLNKDIANKAATKKGLLFCEGDVLFGKLRPYLHNFYKPSFSGVAIGDFWVLRPAKNIDSSFLYSLIQAPKYDAISNLSAGSKMPRSDWNLVSKAEFSVPNNLAEQRKIGNVLSLIDETIVLHQRKLDALNKLKKALLQKMFPAEGEDKPLIRFAGFADSWEQRKLNDVSKIYDGVHQTPNYQPSGIMFLSVENINTLNSNKFISEEAFKKEFKQYPKKGDILMTRIGDVGTVNVVESSEPIAFYVSLALIKPVQVDSYFLENCIRSDSFQDGLGRKTLKTAVPMKINKEEIGTIILKEPIIAREQFLIGSFFRNIDSSIVLHQRKLDALKKLKKALLQKMFI